MTQNELKDLFLYDPITGIFTNKIRRSGSCAGKKAGSLNNNGYALIRINKKNYAAHRLAWLYMYGAWPTFEIDHINMVRHDNRICNLREVTRFQNSQNTGLNSNNTSGHKGVHWDTTNSKWKGQIRLNGKRFSLGYFINLNDAILARKQAEEQLHSHRRLEA